MKILIINENRHNSTGGIEKYTNQLINIFSKHNHEIYEYAFNLNPERIDLYKHNDKCIPLNRISKTDNPLSMVQKRKVIKNCMNEINSIWKDYDVIINQCANMKWSKEIYNSNKWIYVQHFNPDFYKQKYIAGSFLRPLIYYGMMMVGIKNPFKKFKNQVFFTENDKQIINSKSIKYACIPLAVYSKKEIENIRLKQQNKIGDKPFIFFGRLDNFQKKITYTSNIFNKCKSKIDFYGSGDSSLINQSEYSNYLGLIKPNEITDTLSQYKYNVVLSKYEGFPFTIVESISNGIPTIASNFAPSAKWLTDNKGAIVNKKNIIETINSLNNIDNTQYLELRNNCYEFALENLTLEAFENKWMEFINKIKY